MVILPLNGAFGRGWMRFYGCHEQYGGGATGILMGRSQHVKPPSIHGTVPYGMNCPAQNANNIPQGKKPRSFPRNLELS